MTAETTTRQSTLELLERLIAFETESQKTNLPLIEAVAEHCRRAGAVVEVVPNAKGDKAALIATVGPVVEGGLVLSGHTDVVPVAGQSWSSDPYRLRREGSRLYGRGTTDMKAFDAIALAMIPEFRAAELTRPVHIVLSYDEELTCLGPMDIIARFGRDLPRPAAVIVGEPTSLQVADSHKSVCTYRTIVEGVEAHSSKPALGAHAIAAACEIACEINRLGEQYRERGDTTGRFDPGYSTVHVGRMFGGEARNILARRCELFWEFRGLPWLPLNTAQAAVEHYTETTALPYLNRFGHAGRITTEMEVEVPGLMPDPGSLAERIATRSAHTNRTVSVSFATEGGRFQLAGVPTVICGPGSIDQAHQPDEFIEMAEIEAGLAFMRRLIDELR